MSKPLSDDDVRQLLERNGTRTSSQHDKAVLAAARAMAAQPVADTEQPPRHAERRWGVPLGLAASFVAGVLLTSAVVQWRSPETSSAPPTLMLPLDTTRSSGDRSIPVEQAQPDDWYRYIQELIAAGHAQEAERHLRRFNELHPDYVPQP